MKVELGKLAAKTIGTVYTNTSGSAFMIVASYDETFDHATYYLVDLAEGVVIGEPAKSISDVNTVGLIPIDAKLVEA